VVAHLGQVEDIDGHVQVLGEGPGQGGLAGAGRAVEQPAALPGDALLQIPGPAAAPQLDLLDQLLDALGEDQVAPGRCPCADGPCPAGRACAPANDTSPSDTRPVHWN